MRIHISAHHVRYIESKGWLETAVTGRKMHVHANSSVGLCGYREVQNQVAECTTAPVWEGVRKAESHDTFTLYPWASSHSFA